MSPVHFDPKLSIDWNYQWQSQIRNATRYDMVEDPGSFWDKRARGFQQSANSQDRLLPIFKHMDIPEHASILDIGAGTGGLAIPFAMKGHPVTAIEPSRGMLDCMAENISAAGVSNLIRTIQKRWEDVTLGKDITQHDLVIAANSLGVLDIRSTLEKMIQSAKKSVCILMFAGSHPPFMAADIWPLVHDQPYNPFPDYIVVVNILYTMNIFSNVSLWSDQRTQYFPDLDAVISYYREMMDIQHEKKLPVLRNYLKSRLDKTDKGLAITHQWQMAMIHWPVTPST